MVFPIKILPKPKYKRIELDLSQYHLIQWSDKDTTNDDSISPTDFSPQRQHLLDLSTSLLGVFVPAHFNIELTDSGKEIYNHYCEPNTQVAVPKEHEHFTWQQKPSTIYIPIGSIKDRECPAEVNKEKRMLYCRVLHTPMKWNYWHFSIYWEENGERVTTKPNKTVAHLMRALLAEFATFEQQNNVGIPVEAYCKGWKPKVYAIAKRMGLRGTITKILVALHLKIESHQ